VLSRLQRALLVRNVGLGSRGTPPILLIFFVRRSSIVDAVQVGGAIRDGGVLDGNGIVPREALRSAMRRDGMSRDRTPGERVQETRGDAKAREASRSMSPDRCRPIEFEGSSPFSTPRDHLAFPLEWNPSCRSTFDQDSATASKRCPTHAGRREPARRELDRSLWTISRPEPRASTPSRTSSNRPPGRPLPSGDAHRCSDHAQIISNPNRPVNRSSTTASANHFGSRFGTPVSTSHFDADPLRY